MLGVSVAVFVVICVRCFVSRRLAPCDQVVWCRGVGCAVCQVLV